MSYLLDSHTMLWAIYAPDRLPARARELLEDKTIQVIVSHVSIWEIVAKAGRNRLEVTSHSATEIARDVLSFGAALEPILLDDIVSSASLPQHHLDPFDRLLIAQAQRMGATLVSKDRKFGLYDVSLMWG